MLRGADFNNGTHAAASRSTAATGSVSTGVLEGRGQPRSARTRRLSSTPTQYLPVYYEVSAADDDQKPTGGWKSNAYVIFDYFSPTDFKFAGIDISTNKVVIGQRTSSGWNVLASSNKQMFANRGYDVLLVVDGLNVTVTVDGSSAATLQYDPRFVDGRAFGLNKGLIGLGADNARGSFDNFVVRTVPPSSAFAYEDDFADGQAQGLGVTSGGWSVTGGRYSGSAASNPAISLVTTPSSVGYETYVELQARLTSTGIGGFVFDYYSDEDYKYVTIDPATGTLVIGHRIKKRWVTDAGVARPVSGDQLMQIGLRGTTVTVLQNGVQVASFSYNAGVVDGSTGFLSRSGSASYDDVKFMAGTQVTTSPDSTPPTLTAPGNLTRPTDPGKATAFVSNTSIGTALATDNLAGVVVTRSGVPTGNLFSIGVTEITWTATDVFGNKTVKTQTVTVSDLEKPTLTAPPNVVRAVSPGATSVVVTNAELGSPVASDNAGGVTVTRSGVPAGNVFSLGTTTITYTAIDAAGNVTIVTQRVTVVGLLDLSRPANQATQEGKPTTFSLGTITGGTGTSWQVSVDWGDGTTSSFATASTGALSASHTYVNDRATAYSVRVTVVDSTGASDAETFTVAVANVAPSATISSPVNWSSFSMGAGVPVVVPFTDPGRADTHTCTINWGNGTTTTGAVSESNGSGTCSGTLAYTVAGDFTIVATVRDNAGASTTASVIITIKKNTGKGMTLDPGTEAPAADPATLDEPTLAQLIESGKAYWVTTLGAGDQRLALLEGLTFDLDDLPGLTLGMTEGKTITINRYGAGYGWFVAGVEELDGRVDAEEVVEHELGHALGFEHEDANEHVVMGETYALDNSPSASVDVPEVSDAVLPTLDPAADPGSGPSPPDPWAMTLALDETHTISLTGDGDDLVLTVDGVSTSRSAASVSSISVTGGAQSDSFAVAAGIVVPISLDGGAGTDTLAGPGGDQTWTITGSGAGTVGTVSFSGMETLAGAAGNEDTFVLKPGASVGGTLDGGDGGFDSLVLEGDHASVRYTASGPASGSIDLGDGTVVRYAGLEPITSTGTATDAIVEASAGVDVILVELDTATPGNIKVSSASATFESISLAMPTSSLTVRGLDGSDSITVTALTGFTGTLIIEGGNGNDRIDVSAYGGAATLRGGADDDVLTGGVGVHVFDGGTGVNTVDESGVVAFWPATLAATDTTLTRTPPSGSAETDTLTSIQRLVLVGANGTSSLAGSFATFSGQLVFTSAPFRWVEQGAGPANAGTPPTGTGTGVDVVPGTGTGGPVAGAINVVVVHPGLPNTMYVGAVNGGVWKTENGGATWVPLTDQYPSLAISALALDFDDPNTIYAGTGSSSSYGNEGGAAVGVFKSTNGGTSWTLIGSTFRGERVTGIVAKGSLVLVATGSPDRSAGGDYAFGGLYRSTNGGGIFTELTAVGVPLADDDSDGVADERSVIRATVVAPGSGYNDGDTVTATLPGLTSLAPTEFKVIKVGGVVVAVRLVSVGAFTGSASIRPFTVVTTTTGGGSGLTLDITLARNEYGLPAPGLSRTPVSELKVQPPASPSDPLVVYAALSREGIFRSDDGGLHWINVTNDIPFELVGAAGDDETVRIRLATTGTNDVYVAIARDSGRLFEDVTAADITAGIDSVKIRLHSPFFVPFMPGDKVKIGSGTSEEEAEVESVSHASGYAILTLTKNLTKPHTILAAIATANAGKSAKVDLSGAPAAGEQWIVTVNGTDRAYTVTAGNTVQNVAEKLAEVIRNAGGGFVARSDGTTLVVTRVDGTAFTTAFRIQPVGSGTPSGAGAVDGTTPRTATLTFSGQVTPGDFWEVTVDGKQYNVFAWTGSTLEDLADAFANGVHDDADFSALRDGTTVAIVRLDGTAITLASRVVTGGVRVGASGSNHFAALYRSSDRGMNWSPIALPGTSTDGGVSQGGQAERHFSFIADPTNAAVIYVGGDADPATNMGILFRYDGSSWGKIYGADAGGTTPHADSRNMVFADTSILEVDDGGIYRLSDPSTSARRWSSLNGNLRVFEFTSVAWDPVNDVITGGSQDNGVVRQNAPGSYEWTEVLGGDGMMTVTGATATTSYTYTSYQRFGGLSKIVHTSGGSYTVVRLYDELELNGTGIFDDDDLLRERLDKTLSSRLRWPIAVNAVDPAHFLMGSEVIYEEDEDLISIGSGEDVSLRNGKPLRRLLIFPTSDIPETARIGRIEAMVYGGFERDTSGNLVGKKDIAYVVATNLDKGPSGTITGPGEQQKDGSLWVRVGAADDGYNFVRVDSFTAAVNAASSTGRWIPLDVTVHPEDWRQVYVLDSWGRVWHSMLTSSITAPIAFSAWTEITKGSNLTTSVDSLAVVVTDRKANNDTRDDTVAVVVGARGGVFATNVDLSTHSPASRYVFREIGVGLPNIAVMDVVYDARDDLLLAGTLGRGAWTLTDATKALATARTTVILGSTSATTGDQIVLKRSAGSPWLLDVYLSTPAGALSVTPTATYDLSSIAAVVIDGRAGNDNVLIDGTNGPVSVPGGIAVTDTSGAADVLRILNHANDRQHRPASGIPADGIYRFIAADSFSVSGASTVLVTATGVEDMPYVRINTTTVPGITNYLDHAPESEFQGGLEQLSTLARNLFEAAAGTSLGAIDTATLSSALNGLLFKGIRTSLIRSFQQVAPGQAIQIDTGTSFLERLLEPGIDFDTLAELLAGGPVALRDALLAAGAAVTATELDGTTPVGGSSAFADGVLYDVRLTKSLNGIIDLAAVGDALVTQLGLGSALQNAIEVRGMLEISVDVRVNLVFGIDGSGFFIVPNPVDAEFVVERLEVAGAVTANGRFGFLGVEISDVTLAVDPGVALRFDLVEPGTPDGKLRLAELFENITDVVTFSLISPGTHDVVVRGTLTAAAPIPGIDSFNLASTDFELTWANLASSTSVSATVSNDPGQSGSSFLNFLKLNPQALLDQLGTIKTQLAQLVAEADVTLPFLNESLQSRVDVAQVFATRILSQLDFALGGGESRPNFSSAQELLTGLAASLTDVREDDDSPVGFEDILISLGDLGLNYDETTGELTYDVNAQFRFSVSDSFDLDFGIGGASASAVDLGVVVTIAFTLGIDIGDLDFSVGSILDNVFVRNASVAVTMDVSTEDLNLAALGVSISGDSLEGGVAISFSLVDPSSTPDGRISVRELVDTVTSSPFDLIDNLIVNGSLTGSNVTIDLFGVVHVTADVDFDQEQVDVDLDGAPATIELQSAALTTFGLNFTEASAIAPETLFLRVGTSANFGLTVNDGTLAFVILSPGASADSRRWFAVEAHGLAGALVLDSFASATATGVQVLFNRATDADVIDWTSAIDLDESAASFDPDDVVVGLETIDLGEAKDEVSGELTSLNILDVLRGAAGFEIRRELVDVDVESDGFDVAGDNDLDDATLMTFGLDLNEGGATETRYLWAGTDGFGVKLLDGTIRVATIAPAASGDTRRWFGVEALGITGSLLMGSITSPTLTDGQLRLNVANGSTPLVWQTAVDLNEAQTSFDADDVLVLSQPITLAGDELLIKATLPNLNIAGFVTGNVTFEFSMRSVDVDLPGLSTDLFGASLMSFDIDISNLKIGDPNGVHFAASLGSFGLVSLRSGTPGDDRSWFAIRGNLTTPTFAGIPDFNLPTIPSLLPELNLAFGQFDLDGPGGSDPEQASPLDWSKIDFDLDGIFNLPDFDSVSIGGFDIDFDGPSFGASAPGVAINLLGFVTGTVDLFFSQKQVDVDADGDGDINVTQLPTGPGARGPPDLIGATLSQFGLAVSGTGLSIGIPGGPRLTTTGGTLAIAYVTPSDVDQAAGDNRSWLALVGSIDTASLTGVTGITVNASSIVVEINQAYGSFEPATGDPADADELDWSIAIDGYAGGLPYDIDADGDTDVTIALDDGFQLGARGTLGLSLANSFVVASGFVHADEVRGDGRHVRPGHAGRRGRARVHAHLRAAVRRHRRLVGGHGRHRRYSGAVGLDLKLVVGLRDGWLQRGRAEQRGGVARRPLRVHAQRGQPGCAVQRRGH